jgi:hypothetical protein
MTKTHESVTLRLMYPKWVGDKMCKDLLLKNASSSKVCIGPAARCGQVIVICFTLS